MLPNSGYFYIDAEEIIKETDTAFLLRYGDGEQGWIPKREVAHPTRYSVGDRDVSLQLRDGVE